MPPLMPSSELTLVRSSTDQISAAPSSQHAYQTPERTQSSLPTMVLPDLLSQASGRIRKQPYRGGGCVARKKSPSRVTLLLFTS